MHLIILDTEYYDKFQDMMPVTVFLLGFPMIQFLIYILSMSENWSNFFPIIYLFNHVNTL